MFESESFKVDIHGTDSSKPSRWTMIDCILKQHSVNNLISKKLLCMNYAHTCDLYLPSMFLWLITVNRANNMSLSDSMQAKSAAAHKLLKLIESYVIIAHSRSSLICNSLKYTNNYYGWEVIPFSGEFFTRILALLRLWRPSFTVMGGSWACLRRIRKQKFADEGRYLSCVQSALSEYIRSTEIK